MKYLLQNRKTNTYVHGLYLKLLHVAVIVIFVILDEFREFSTYIAIISN